MLDNEQKTPSRQAFEAWYVTQSFDYVENSMGSRDCKLQWDAWQAACLDMIRVANELHEREREWERTQEILGAPKNFILENALTILKNKIQGGMKFSDALDRVLLLFGSITKDELVAAYDAQEPK